jgi:hypothetical protein
LNRNIREKNIIVIIKEKNKIENILFDFLFINFVEYTREMPTSNGYDRNNYVTTTNFNKTKWKRYELGQGDQQAQSDSSEYQPSSRRSRYARNHRNKRLANSSERYDSLPFGETHSIEPTKAQAPKSIDETHVSIGEPKLRELVKKLVRSEQERVEQNIDPNLITQIDHKGYTLYLSKKGPLNVNQNKELFSRSSQTNSSLANEDYARALKKSSTRSSSTQTSGLNMQRASNYLNAYDYRDNKGVHYEISHLSSKDATPTKNANVTELPAEIVRMIEEDMAKNPSASGERTYKIVISKSNTQQPQVVRLLVANQPMQATYGRAPSIKTLQPVYLAPPRLYSLTPIDETNKKSYKRFYQIRQPASIAE